jgi:hypothetical protein
MRTLIEKAMSPYYEKEREAIHDALLAMERRGLLEHAVNDARKRAEKLNQPMNDARERVD